MNKTLYIRDEDEPVWDRAREIAGDKLSPMLVKALKAYILKKESEAAESKGFEKIVLRFRDSDDNEIPKAKAFMGKWIVPPEESYGWTFEDYRSDPNKHCFAVAQTAKGRAVIYAWLEDEDRKHSHQFMVFESLEEAAADPRVNMAALHAIEKVGVPVEELDI